MSSSTVTIPIAGFRDVYDVPSVEKALHDLPASANEALRAVYEKMLRLGGQRFTVKPSALPEMERLFEELPNFRDVLEDIRKHLALCVDSNDSIGAAALATVMTGVETDTFGISANASAIGVATTTAGAIVSVFATISAT